ncbi:MAG: L-rhamnose mutarotase [Verrucomicrobia bacterium]|nr:L-rhamnose mutarotase [Verrucomicrobiota bacterium]
MTRTAFLMTIKPGNANEYIRRHRAVWSDLVAVLKLHGVSNYSIYHHAPTGQLFGYAEVVNVEQWEAIARTPECRRWWAYMEDVMVYNSDHTPNAEPLTEVYHLD